MAAPLRRDGDDILLAIRGKPGARRDSLVGVEGECIKIAIAAPPEKGRATEHLLRFLADIFGVSRSRVTLVSGEFSAMKRVRIERPETIPKELLQLLDEGGNHSL